MGQRPAETFFQIRGEERMEGAAANEEKEGRNPDGVGDGESEVGARGRRRLEVIANSLC